MNGYIHSIESFGTVDGPGLRFVVFTQGCPMRCKYCHNPDTWEVGKGNTMSPEEIIAQFERNREFYKNGGITVTGGEPLLQIDFMLALFRLAKEKGIHTCIDTSGITYREGESAYNQKLDELMTMTDLVMLDIKHIDDDAHKELTGQHNTGILAFARYLDSKHVPLWIRHVIVPGITDDPEEHKRLARFIAHLSNIKALDVLPYHTMGVSKYEKLGIPYPLEGLEALPKQEAAKAKETIIASLREERMKMANNA